MKIDQDLRMAIRCAERMQPDNGYAVKYKAEAEAVVALMRRKPSIASKIRTANKQKKMSEKLEAQSEKTFDSLGLTHYDYKKIGNEERFVRVGGKLPEPPKRRWKFDQVMAELAAADSKQLNTILTKYGIKWS